MADANQTDETVKITKLEHDIKEVNKDAEVLENTNKNAIQHRQS